MADQRSSRDELSVTLWALAYQCLVFEPGHEATSVAFAAHNVDDMRAASLCGLRVRQGDVAPLYSVNLAGACELRACLREFIAT